MLHFESDVQFSELISQCIALLGQDKFDDIFEVLAKYEIPKQGSVVLAKALWLRLKIDRMHENYTPAELEERTVPIRRALREAFAILQETYIHTTQAYIETGTGFEVMPEPEPKAKNFLVKRKKNLDSFFSQKVILLDDFMAFVEDFGLVRLEDSGELKRMDGKTLTWEGKAGSVAAMNPHHHESDFYLIFWPVSDKMYQQDPLVAFFHHRHKPVVDKIVRGDKVVLRGCIEINKEAPKIVMRNTELLKHIPREFGFSLR